MQIHAIYSSFPIVFEAYLIEAIPVQNSFSFSFPRHIRTSIRRDRPKILRQSYNILYIILYISYIILNILYFIFFINYLPWNMFHILDTKVIQAVDKLFYQFLFILWLWWCATKELWRCIWYITTNCNAYNLLGHFNIDISPFSLAFICYFKTFDVKSSNISLRKVFVLLRNKPLSSSKF